MLKMITQPNTMSKSDSCFYSVFECIKSIAIFSLCKFFFYKKMNKRKNMYIFRKKSFRFHPLPLSHLFSNWIQPQYATNPDCLINLLRPKTRRKKTKEINRTVFQSPRREFNESPRVFYVFYQIYCFKIEEAACWNAEPFVCKSVNWSLAYATIQVSISDVRFFASIIFGQSTKKNQQQNIFFSISSIDNMQMR